MILICDYLGKWEVGSTTGKPRMYITEEVQKSEGLPKIKEYHDSYQEIMKSVPLTIYIQEISYGYNFCIIKYLIETGRMMTPVDVMRDLLRHGINKDHFMARAELDIGEDEIALLDTEDGVKQEVWAYLTSSISEPMAFVNKSSSSGFSRVLVFTVCGVQGVYDRYNLMFAFQVIRGIFCIPN